MTPAPAKLQFVSSLFASKIFWAQIVSLVALILSAAGYKVLDAPGAQEQIIGMLDGVATIALRLLFPTGPVSLTAPLSTPPSQDVQAGASVVNVPAPADRTQTTDVQPLAVGTHTVEVMTPTALTSPERVSTTVVTTPAP